MEKKDLESTLEILSEELSKEHNPNQLKHLTRIKDAYCILQLEYKQLTKHLYKPKDFSLF